jgi:CRISPR-associated exonuclease Cas4
MNITGTHIHYYFICHRKLWLFANGIHMEHNSELVDEGRLIHETSYPKRAEKYQEVELDGIKIDFFDPETKTVHEIKKTNKMEEAHEWQLKYYLHVLQNNGIEDARGILEYPKLRQTSEVTLSQADNEKISEIIRSVEQVIYQEKVPEKIDSYQCKKCSYRDFCYAGEE